ncbi:MAG: hypothetical protein JXR36_04635 [Bacteroidales bacterium]|nr:hypothetical protein [Bacteroidales bacterium]
MKKISFLTFLTFAILLSSCNPNRIYEKHRKNFTDYKWNKTNVLEFSPVIDDIDAEYQIHIAFRHIYGFQNDAIDLNVEVTTPSGDVSNNIYTINVRSGNEYFGECAGDYCDLEQIIQNNYKFPETGTYKYKITQVTNDDPLQWVMEVGLIVDKIVTE